MNEENECMRCWFISWGLFAATRVLLSRRQAGLEPVRGGSRSEWLGLFFGLLLLAWGLTGLGAGLEGRSIGYWGRYAFPSVLGRCDVPFDMCGLGIGGMGWLFGMWCDVYVCMYWGLTAGQAVGVLWMRRREIRRDQDIDCEDEAVVLRIEGFGYADIIEASWLSERMTMNVNLDFFGISAVRDRWDGHLRKYCIVLWSC